jgi:UDP-2,3-diacylglucosamine pyrophosphatase LpxH
MSDVATNFKIFYSGPNDQHNLETQTYQNKGMSVPSKVELTGLTPSSRYAYAVAFQNAGKCTSQTTSTLTFSTAKSRSSTFNFGIIADIHLNDEGAFTESVLKQTYSQILKAVNSPEGLDFIVDIGDTFLGEKLPDLWQYDAEPYQRIFRLYSEVCAQAGLYLVNGNHDGELGWVFLGQEIAKVPVPERRPVKYAQQRLSYFSNPFPNQFYSGNEEVEIPSLGHLGNYYAFEWGNALIVGLDPYWYTRDIVNVLHKDPDGVVIKQDPWTWTLGKTQYEWLYRTLATSKAKYKFMFAHHLVGGVWGTPKEGGGGGGPYYANFFEWGGYDINGRYAFDQKRPGWAHGSIHEMCVKYGVSAVFKGHDHLFHTGELNGIVYHTLPKPSVDTLNAPPHMAAERGFPPEETMSENGYLRVRVAPDSATVTFTTFAGEVWDQYTIRH